MAGSPISLLPPRSAAQLLDTDMLPLAIGTMLGDNRKTTIGDLKAVMQPTVFSSSQTLPVSFSVALPFFVIPGLNVILQPGVYKIDFSSFMEAGSGDCSIAYRIVYNSNTSIVTSDPTDLTLAGSIRKASASTLHSTLFSQGILTLTAPAIVKVAVQSSGPNEASIINRILIAVKLS
jgi:hypothetical protein